MELSLNDTAGNRMIIISHSRTKLIKLHLKGEAYLRSIGVIDTVRRVLTVNKERAKHLHKKSQSYGFNYALIKDAKTFDSIIIVDDVGVFEVSREKLLAEGNILYFKQQGFERQIFIPINKLNQLKSY